ncbi:MAG: MATE family efflux transporter [Clostridia bacterium]|nr:MATE family efflux transporter [Clostridia bacterium]
MTSNKQTELMSKAPVTKAILKMSIPVVCGMMVQVLYNLVDTFFIGKLNDENQLAAANITTPIFMLMMAVATIVSTGAASYISRCLGKKDDKSANRTLSTGVVICTGLAVVIMILGLVFIKPFITLLGATPLMYPYALSYASIMFIGAIPVMLSYAGGQLVRSEGAVMPSIVGMMLGTVINVILDPIFIFGLNMGIQGAAIATVLGNVGAMGYYIWYYASGKSLVKFNLKDICGEKKIWGQTFAIGIPAALSQFLMSAALIVCNNLAKPYGENAVAGMGVAAKLMYIGTFIFMGFAAGCQPLVGFNFGAKNFPRVKEIIKSGMLITEGIGIALTVLFGVFASGLVSIFSPLPEVISAGATVLCIYMWSFLVLGPQMLASTTIQAFGKAKASLILSIARQGLFYIPLLLLLNRNFSFSGLLWAQPIADAITLALGLVLLVVILKKCFKSVTFSDASVSTKAAVPGLVITISREYGSGGREIGEKLAVVLGVPYYDKKLIDMTAKQSGLDSEMIVGIEESVTDGFSYSPITGAYYAGSIFAYDDTPDSDNIFTSQSNVITSLAKEGSCVIVGRCADAVLTDRASTFNVFIKACADNRIQRVTEQYGLSKQDALSTICCVDKVRANYYKHYTGKQWGAIDNYDLILDSGTLGIDGCIDVILKAVNVNFLQ